MEPAQTLTKGDEDEEAVDVYKKARDLLQSDVLTA